MAASLPGNSGKPIDVIKQSIGEAAPLPAAAQKKTHTLTDMSQDYVFFTPAVLNTASPLRRDVVYDCGVALGITASLVIVDYAFPFFKGLGAYKQNGQLVRLNNRLYGVPHEHWEQLKNCIAGISMVDWDTKFYGKVNYNYVTIIDHFALKKMAVVNSLPVLDVAAFCLATNTMTAYMEETAASPNVPMMVTGPPQQSIINEANDLFTHGPGRRKKKRKK